MALQHGPEAGRGTPCVDRSGDGERASPSLRSRLEPSMAQIRKWDSGVQLTLKSQ